MKNLLSVTLLLTFFVAFSAGQAPAQDKPEADNAEAIVERAVDYLGGPKYLNVTSQVSRGRFSIFKEGVVVSFQSFLDIIVFPDKERTDFKSSGVKIVQTNIGDTGWIFDGNVERIKDQDENQIENFKRGIRTSLDNLLRGKWRGEATLSYVGRRQATLGKRNDVVKLVYEDGLTVEFEFAAENAQPAKALFIRTGADGEEIREEDRYAQFVEVGGIRTPFIIDRFTDGAHSSRINYESVEYNRTIPESIFAKPSNPKDMKKDLKI